MSASTTAATPAAGDLLATVDMALNTDIASYTGCPNVSDNVRVTLYNVSAAGALVNGSFRIWFED